MDENGLETSAFVLATIYRAENTGHKEKLTEIVSSLNQINKTIPVIIPLHPRTRKILEDLESKKVCQKQGVIRSR